METKEVAPAADANLRLAQDEQQAEPELFGLALNVQHKKCHQAADAFWKYWNENGETHKRGYYESTWGAINQAIKLVGVHPHTYGGTIPAFDFNPPAQPQQLTDADLDTIARDTASEVWESPKDGDHYDFTADALSNFARALLAAGKERT